MEAFLAVALVYLGASVLLVPLAKRLGLGAVVGYLVAGVLIGPHVLRLAGQSAEDLHRASEFGVVMLLFLVGLELNPRRLWQMRVAVFGMGAAQVLGAALVLAAAALAFGLPWRGATAFGMLIAMSSTAVALAALQERKLNGTPGGQAAFSVLLFQDLAVIPVLAVLPLLATGATAAGAQEAHGVGALPGWMQAGAVLVAVVALVVGGRFLLNPLFRFVAASGLREAFTATALALLAGVAMLMHLVGMSPALGAFLAGVVLAESEYRHELQADLEPFRGLLLGLFFVTAGAAIDLRVVAAHPLALLGLVTGILAVKTAFQYGMARAFGLGDADARVFASSLAQIGEFALVGLAIAGAAGVLSGDAVSLLAAATAASMALTPPWVALFRPRAVVQPVAERHDDVAGEGAAVIVAGFGRTGNIVGRLLRAQGVACTVLDANPRLVDSVRKNGLTAWYGDATRRELLESAGAAHAKALVIAVDDPVACLHMADLARKHWPHLRVIARARARDDAYGLLHLGVDRVHRETFGAALAMGVDALKAVGMNPHRAHRGAERFRKFNEEQMREMAKTAKEGGNFRERLRAVLRQEEGMLTLDEARDREAEAAWNNESLADEMVSHFRRTPPPS